MLVSSLFLLFCMILVLTFCLFFTLFAYCLRCSNVVCVCVLSFLETQEKIVPLFASCVLVMVCLFIFGMVYFDFCYQSPKSNSQKIGNSPLLCFCECPSKLLLFAGNTMKIVVSD